MRTKTVLITVEQATRDALPQLLLAQYLREKGVTVRLCNQGTFLPMCIRYRPDLVYVDWMGGTGAMNYLRSIRQRTHIVAMDQEGGRLRKEVVKRAFDQFNGAKRAMAALCSKVFVWGSTQAEWLKELDVAHEDKIVVTGSPRWDPYIVLPKRDPSDEPYIGVTLRADMLTASPTQFMQHLYHYRVSDPVDGIALGYPLRAEFEDRVWHITASTRYLFRLAEEATKRTKARVVFRPGPWEQQRVYDFLPQGIPGATVETGQLQHDYVRGAFVILDDASNLGLEALLAGTPVISIQAFIPRLEEHIGGQDAGLFNAPFTQFYWKPKTLEDALDYIDRAKHGRLPLTPDPNGLKDYCRNAYAWPASRPSSFVIGDAIMELLQSPPSGEGVANTAERGPLRNLKDTAYRYMPGAVSLMKMKMFARCILSADRQSLMRYHYFQWWYPHHKTIRDLFACLKKGDMAPFQIGGKA